MRSLRADDPRVATDINSTVQDGRQTDTDIEALHRLVQLNMGEGKTSVIVPILAATLGDGENLCRVLVPNALLNTNAANLAHALGGILGRRVWSVPCRRDVQFTTALATDMAARLEECRAAGDIVITTLESVLSFQLKIVELARQSNDEGTVKVARRSHRSRQTFTSTAERFWTKPIHSCTTAARYVCIDSIPE